MSFVHRCYSFLGTAPCIISWLRSFLTPCAALVAAPTICIPPHRGACAPSPRDSLLSSACPTALGPHLRCRVPPAARHRWQKFAITKDPLQALGERQLVFHFRRIPIRHLPLQRLAPSP